ncbi:OB-fold domain-containing protein [uncultured Hydrogenophaga sp.]|uniref:Zn-ribbon domain-containing OB-fold protein n=1 Tax=uncultured Hydrogenophaga sp. TaxID=199683 RepID=UPI00258F57F2|nr:OB-fold domain-containing protein [uncultured Hydrogenophaga sp.]
MTPQLITIDGRDFPAPQTCAETLPYWDGAARGELWLRRCTACAKAHHYPRSICPFCFVPDTRWERASGRGTLYSYCAVLRAAVPYVIAYVRLEEGPVMLTNLTDCDPARLVVGMPVSLAPARPGATVQIPVFRPG